MLTEVDPRDVRFTQGSISINFKSPHEDTRIDDAVNMIVSGEWHPSIFPAIEVVEYLGQLWSLDNRRLWVFRKAKLKSITVNIKKFSKHQRFLNMLDNPNFMTVVSSKNFFPRVRGKDPLKPLRRPESVFLPGVGRQSTVKPDSLDDMPNFPSVDSTIRSDDHRFDVPPVDPVVEEKATEDIKSLVERVREFLKSLWDFIKIFGGFLRSLWEFLKFTGVSFVNGCCNFVYGAMRMLQDWLRGFQK